MNEITHINITIYNYSGIGITILKCRSLNRKKNFFTYVKEKNLPLAVWRGDLASFLGPATDWSLVVAEALGAPGAQESARAESQQGVERPPLNRARTCGRDNSAK